MQPGLLSPQSQRRLQPLVHTCRRTARRCGVAIIGSIMFLALGCQTISYPKHPVNLPATIDGLFEACAPSDGSLGVSAYNREELLGRFDLDWLAPNRRNWRAEADDPVGNALATVVFQGPHDLRVSGEMLADLNGLSVDYEGFLRAREHFVGLRAAELPCFFKARLPASWHQEVLSFTMTEGEAVIEIAEPKRWMEVHVPAALAGDVCTTIGWSEYLGVLRREINWCFAPDGKRKSSLSGSGGYSLQWSQSDDG